MRQPELHRYGNLSVRGFLIVSVLAGALSLIDQDQTDIPLPQGHGMILEQALEPDLDDTKTPALPVFGNTSAVVALLSFPHVRDRIPEQSYQPFPLSSVSIFQRCSTYRI